MSRFFGSLVLLFITSSVIVHYVQKVHVILMFTYIQSVTYYIIQNIYVTCLYNKPQWLFFILSYTIIKYLFLLYRCKISSSSSTKNVYLTKYVIYPVWKSWEKQISSKQCMCRLIPLQYWSTFHLIGVCKFKKNVSTHVDRWHDVRLWIKLRIGQLCSF